MLYICSQQGAGYVCLREVPAWHSNMYYHIDTFHRTHFLQTLLWQPWWPTAPESLVDTWCLQEVISLSLVDTTGPHRRSSSGPLTLLTLQFQSKTLLQLTYRGLQDSAPQWKALLTTQWASPSPTSSLLTTALLWSVRLKEKALQLSSLLKVRRTTHCLYLHAITIQACIKEMHATMFTKILAWFQCRQLYGIHHPYIDSTTYSCLMMR